MARGDVRIGVTLACEECKRRNYMTNKSKRNNPDRIALRKFCKWCRHAHEPPGDPVGASRPVARDRQRAKQRKQRREPHPAPSATRATALDARARPTCTARTSPARCEHSGEVDEFEAALVAGADGEPEADPDAAERASAGDDGGDGAERRRGRRRRRRDRRRRARRGRRTAAAAAASSTSCRPAGPSSSACSGPTAARSARPPWSSWASSSSPAPSSASPTSWPSSVVDLII